MMDAHMVKKTLIEEGDNVILKREDSSRIYQVRRKRMVHFWKSKFSVEELIGQPYGSTFELDRGRLSRVDPLSPDVAMGASGLDQRADNRNLHDTEKNQKMSKEEIMKMKDEGIAGEKIIEELVENSETFKTKTEFSQAKYLKKKKKRHMMVFTVHQPTPRLVMEMYTSTPGKLNFLRPDSLSQVLSFCNVMHGSRVAVMESCQGLLVASLLHRMGGGGTLLQLIPNNQNPPTRNIVDYFSFPKSYLDTLYTVPLDQLTSLTSDPSTEGGSDGGHSPDMECAPTGDGSECPEGGRDAGGDELRVETELDGSAECDNGQSEVVSDGQAKVGSSLEGESHSAARAVGAEGGGEGMSTDQGDKSTTESQSEKPFVKNRDLQRLARAKRLQEAGNILRTKALDSLVIACKYNPVPVLRKMLTCLGPSRAVVVYSQYLDPLVECYTYVKEQHVGIQLKLTDTWLREYQVLPQRTHPTVNMSGTGGYLLTFLTTEPSQTH